LVFTKQISFPSCQTLGIYKAYLIPILPNLRYLQSKSHSLHCLHYVSTSILPPHPGPSEVKIVVINNLLTLPTADAKWLLHPVLYIIICIFYINLQFIRPRRRLSWHLSSDRHTHVEQSVIHQNSTCNVFIFLYKTHKCFTYWIKWDTNFTATVLEYGKCHRVTTQHYTIQTHQLSVCCCIRRVALTFPADICHSLPGRGTNKALTLQSWELATIDVDYKSSPRYLHRRVWLLLYAKWQPHWSGHVHRESTLHRKSQSVVHSLWKMSMHLALQYRKINIPWGWSSVYCGKGVRFKMRDGVHK
jgi:hypothetical protein